MFINLSSAHVCQSDIPDLFYNANLAGPLFDQSMYTITTSIFSVLSPIGTTVLTFNVQPQTIYTWPSFNVTTLSNGSCALVINTL